MVKLVTFNIWFDERDYLSRSMKIIQEATAEGPDVICFQEVLTCHKEVPVMLRKLGYTIVCSKTLDRPYRELIAVKDTLKVRRDWVVPFPNSQMSRELLVAEIELADQSTIYVGTAHLESMFQFQTECLAQFSLVLKELGKYKDSFFLADTNLNLDGALKMPADWVDTFNDAGAPAAHKYTYASKNNPHIEAKRNISKRYDRVYKHGSTYATRNFRLIGTHNPQSDHYGICVELNRYIF